MPHPYDKFGVGAENSTLELARRNAEITRNYTSIAEQAAQVLAANRRGYEGIVEQAVAAMNAARREYSIIHGEAIDAVRQLALQSLIKWLPYGPKPASTQHSTLSDYGKIIRARFNRSSKWIVNCVRDLMSRG